MLCFIVVVLILLAAFCLAPSHHKKEGYQCSPGVPCPRGQRCATHQLGDGVCMVPGGCLSSDDCHPDYVCRKNWYSTTGQCVHEGPKPSLTLDKCSPDMLCEDGQKCMCQGEHCVCVWMP